MADATSHSFDNRPRPEDKDGLTPETDPVARGHGDLEGALPEPGDEDIGAGEDDEIERSGDQTGEDEGSSAQEGREDHLKEDQKTTSL